MKIGKVKRFLAVLIVVMMIIAVVPQKAMAAKKGSITSVKISNLPAAALTLAKGKTFKLKVKVSAKGKIAKGVNYKSSKPKIVSVSSSGKLKALKKGSAKITVSAKANKKKKAVITVKVGKPVTKVTLNKKSLSLEAGKTATLKATVKPTKATNKKIIWSTSKKSVAKVNSKGKVTAVKAGKATITALAQDGSKKKATCKVTVTAKQTKSGSAASTSASSTATTTTTTDTGTSSAPANIETPSNTQADTTTNNDVKVTNIEVSDIPDTLSVDEEKTLKVTVSPDNATNKQVSYTSSDESVLTVDEKGKVKGIKAGEATVTVAATDGSDKKATVKITVKNKSEKKTTVTATVATGATVQDPRNVKLTLNKAQSLNKSQITVQYKRSDQANFRDTVLVKSISTTDNKTYKIYLKGSLGNDENVKVTVTGLANNKAASSVETYYSGIVRSSTSEETIAYKSGSRTSDTLDYGYGYYSNYYKYEVTSGSLPAGMKRDEKKFGAYVIYGTPTAKSDITIKRTSPHGDTVNMTFHFKLYSKDVVALSGTNTYNLSKTVNNHNTDKVADDTLNNASVDVNLSTNGGQTYFNHGYVKKSDGSFLTSDEYWNQLSKAGNDAYNAEADKYTYVNGDSYYYLNENVENVAVPDTDPADDYTKGYLGDGSSINSETYVKNSAIGTDTPDAEHTDLVSIFSDENHYEKKYYKSTDLVTADDYNELADNYSNYYWISDTKAVKRTNALSSSAYYGILDAAMDKAEEDFAAQYTYKDSEETHYEIVGDAHGLTLSDSGYLSGTLASSATVTVKATKKNTAGTDVSDTITLKLNVEDAKLVKGTVTDINGKAVKNARVNFSNRKVDSAFANNYYNDYYSDATTNDAGQYCVALESSTYYVTVYKNESDTFTKDVVINKDNSNLNFGVGGIAVTLTTTNTDDSAYVPYMLFDNNNDVYSVERINSDSDNNGSYDHFESYQVVLEDNTAYNLVSPDVYYSWNSTGNTYEVIDYNATVSITTNGATVTKATLNINKK